MTNRHKSRTFSRYIQTFHEPRPLITVLGSAISTRPGRIIRTRANRVETGKSGLNHDHIRGHERLRPLNHVELDGLTLY